MVTNPIKKSFIVYEYLQLIQINRLGRHTQMLNCLRLMVGNSTYCRLYQSNMTVYPVLTH